MHYSGTNYSCRKEPRVLPSGSTVFHVQISLAGFARVLGAHENLSAWSEVAKGRDRFENVVVDGRIILICMHVLMAKCVEFLTGVKWLRIGFSGDFRHEHGNQLF